MAGGCVRCGAFLQLGEGTHCQSCENALPAKKGIEGLLLGGTPRAQTVKIALLLSPLVAICGVAMFTPSNSPPASPTTAEVPTTPIPSPKEVEQAKWAFPSNDRAEILAEVDRRLAIGDQEAVVMANSLMNEKFGYDAMLHDPELRPVYDRVKAADAEAFATENAEGAKDRLAGYRDQIAQLEKDRPVRVGDILNDIDVLDGLSRDVMAQPVSKDRWSTIVALRSAQVKMLPIYRAAYGKLMNEQLWPENIAVKASGRTLTFTGGIFASNAAIKTAFDGGSDIYRRLRFSRVEYPWVRGIEEYHYFKLDTPSDGAIGSWNGSSFEPLDAR